MAGKYNTVEGFVTQRLRVRVEVLVARDEAEAMAKATALLRDPRYWTKAECERASPPHNVVVTKAWGEWG